MKTLTKLMQFTLIAGLLTSCKIMYVPNTQNVPMMEEKNDLKVELSTKDLQVAYAVTDHIGIMVNGYYNKNEWSATTSGPTTLEYQFLSKRSLIEGGAGYYTKLGEKGRFETYAGAGYGHIDYDYDLLEDNVKIEKDEFGIGMMRFFVQPAIGSQGDNFGIAFSARVAGVMFSNMDTVNYTQTELVHEDLHELEDNMFIFMEPALTLRFGFKYAQLQLQPYYNFKLSGPAIPAKKFGFNVGLYLNIDELY